MFGGDFIEKGLHFTFPFGLRTKYVDLHLTKETKNEKRRFPIFIIKHENIPQIFSYFFPKFINALFDNLKPETLDSIMNNYTQVIFIQGYDVTKENQFGEKIEQELVKLKSNPESNRIRINEESESLKKFISVLKETDNTIDLSPKKIEIINSVENCTCILINEVKSVFCLKTKDKLMVFDTFELDLKKIIEKTLDEKLLNIIKDHIDYGIRIINSDEYASKKNEFKPFEIIPK
jgi:hypothetical protein